MKDTIKNIIISSSHYLNQKESWLEKLSGDLEPTLFFDVLKKNEGTLGKKSELITIKSELYEKLEKFCMGSDVSLYVTLLTVLKCVAFRYMQKPDIFIGSPILETYKSENTFNQIIPIRTQLSGKMSFKECILTVKDDVIKAYKNQDYPLEKLSGTTPMDTAISDLYDMVCMFENLHSSAEEELVLREKAVLSFTKRNNEIVGTIVYKGEFTEKYNLENLSSHYVNFLDNALDNVHASISSIHYLSDVEETQLIQGFNNLKIDYNKDRTLHQLFEDQVDLIPHQIAVKCGEMILSFHELNARSNQVAQLLRQKGVKPGDTVAILGSRSIETIVSILAILKSGGAYLPIGTQYSEEKIALMIKESQAKLLLTEKESFTNENIAGEEQIVIEDKLLPMDNSNLENWNTGTDLAYTIYTSGTSGIAKGVMIEHRNVLNLMVGLKHNLYNKYKKHLNIAMISPFIFDASVQQIFASLLFGHTLHIIPEDLVIDGEGLISYFDTNHIDISDTTPTHLNIIAKTPKEERESLALSCLIVGGEPLKHKTVKLTHDRFENCEILCVYGPTECCVDSAFYKINRDDSVRSDYLPIGQPSPNEQIYILDENQKPLPIGVPGEVCISGDGVGRGYLHNESFENSKYVENPFFPEQRMYRTGDLGRWLPNGVIEFIGRSDQQVKLRGHRIELGEIEATLLSNDFISEAAVIDMKDPDGDNNLAAYIVAEKRLPTQELQKQLSKKLPGYMVPSYFIQIDHVPLTPSGKLDKQALQGISNAMSTGVTQTASRNATELMIMNVWKKIIGVKEIGIDDNFFEIGGTSILLLIMYEELNELFQNRISVSDLFHYSTIRKISEFINEKESYNLNFERCLLEFPSEYRGSRQQSEQIKFSYDLDRNIVLRIRDIQILEKIDVFHIMYSLFIYLLSEIAETNRISLLSVRQYDRFFVIDLDLEHVKDFPSLFRLVKEKEKLLREEEGDYTLQQIKNNFAKKEDRSIFPLFFQYGTNNKTTLFETFDLILCMRDDDEDRIAIEIEYNYRRLNKDKVKEMLNQFLKMLSFIISQYE